MAPGISVEAGDSNSIMLVVGALSTETAPQPFPAPHFRSYMWWMMNPHISLLARMAYRAQDTYTGLLERMWSQVGGH